MVLLVGLMYNLKKGAPAREGLPADALAELDSEETVAGIADALAAAGHQVVRVEGDEEAYPRLRQVRPDIVFNICEGMRGASRESQVPAMLEFLGIPYAGSGVLSLALALDKAAAKRTFHYHGVPTPAFRVVAPGDRADTAGLRFPLFVKPCCEGSSMGITPQSLVHDPVRLAEQVALVHDTYREPALVEEFLGGREFSVGLVGNEDPVIFPVLEINYSDVPAGHGPIYSYRFKQEWDDDSYYLCPAPVDSSLENALKATALRAFRALGCLDVCRVDLRLDRDGIPNVLEANPLPGLRAGFSDLCRQAESAGWTYEQLINRILEAALGRYRGRSRSGLHPFLL